jgi:PTH1 family peptidyl-tRNA hydrolase
VEELRVKVIVGLGNPGGRYEDTRHNIGFMVIDEIARRLKIDLNKQKFNSNYNLSTVGDEKVVLLKPLTYMNLSGEAVQPFLNFYKADIDDLLVIYDDLDLPVGKLRLRTKGSAGGHNGIKSIIQNLGTQEYKRLRIGVGRPPSYMGIPDYVLQPFQQDELEGINAAITKAADACEDWISRPFLEVMNRHN